MTGHLLLGRAFGILCMAFLAFAAAQAASPNQSPISETRHIASDMDTLQTPLSDKLDTATFGAGCFWCVEAVFQQLKGVVEVKSGYSGGARPNPRYEQVCSGATGHAEVCQIVYNPEEISFPELLEVFWSTHDPTTLNRQGNDVGTQYRSAIFYHNDEQKQLAEQYKHKLDEEKVFSNPVVTEIVPFAVFYPAENYHQNYYNQNGSQPYCSFVIRPKVEKMKKVFGDKLKAEAK